MNPKHFPPAFSAALASVPNLDTEALLASLDEAPPVSVRLNPFKPVPTTEDIFPHSTNIDWCKEGLYLPERPVFTTDPYFQAGAYYVQEASSMFLAEVLGQIFPGRPNIKALDLCAAPGGKSTLVLSAIGDEGLLVSNEVIRTRLPALKQNLEKWGCANVVVANHDPADFVGLSGFFDLVLVDAPCSGEGMFRKDHDARAEWSPDSVNLCAARQKRILADALLPLGGDGVLIYCTCTFNTQENDDNARWIAQRNDIEPIALNVPAAWGIVERDYGGGVGYAFFPHQLRGEGFYLAVFRKKSLEGHAKTPAGKGEKVAAKNFTDWLDNADAFDFYKKPTGEITAFPKALAEEWRIIDQALSRKGMLLSIGELKHQDLVPDHVLALSRHVSPEVPVWELSKEEALQYLRKETLDAQNAPQTGWLLVAYQGLHLGWVKALPNRVNNYLPQEWRVRM